MNEIYLFTLRTSAVAQHVLWAARDCFLLPVILCCVSVCACRVCACVCVCVCGMFGVRARATVGPQVSSPRKLFGMRHQHRVLSCAELDAFIKAYDFSLGDSSQHVCLQLGERCSCGFCFLQQLGVELVDSAQ
jgi:hypothetical protein